MRKFLERLFRMGRKKRPPAPSPTGWYFSYGKPDPVLNADGVSFDWTEKPYVEPHYLLKPQGPLTTAQTLEITYRIDVLSGAPDFQAPGCSGPSIDTGTIAMMIRKDLNNTSYYNRAWWGIRHNTEPGTYTFTAPLAGPGWRFVRAADTPLTHPNEWASLLANCRDVALTFGGCTGAGHGSFVSGGSAKFTIVSAAVN